MASKAAVDRRVAQAVLAEMLGELGVAQDESTAEQMLIRAYAVDRKRIRAAGEVIVLTFQVEPDGAQP